MLYLLYSLSMRRINNQREQEQMRGLAAALKRGANGEDRRDVNTGTVISLMMKDQYEEENKQNSVIDNKIDDKDRNYSEIKFIVPKKSQSQQESVLIQNLTYQNSNKQESFITHNSKGLPDHLITLADRN